jgi:hypothetical protein
MSPKSGAAKPGIAFAAWIGFRFCRLNPGYMSRLRAQHF